jgi:aquaporin Z
MQIKKYVAEFIGTAVLVLMGCGSAVFIGVSDPAGHLAVALAFGLSIVAMAYTIGNISGCHINPAVSLAMLISKKLSVTDFIGYIVAQFLGALVGAGILAYLASIYASGDQTGALGSNSFGTVGMVGAIVVEIILTCIFVFTILGVTSDESKSGVAGIVIGLTLTFVHIVGISLTGTSVNPARSFGPAIFAGVDAIVELWVFIVAPLIGAAIAAQIFKALTSQKAE